MKFEGEKRHAADPGEDAIVQGAGVSVASPVYADQLDHLGRAVDTRAYAPRMDMVDRR